MDKTYYAVVSGIVTEEDVRAMQEGVDIGEEKKTLPARLEIVRTAKNVSEGKEILLCMGDTADRSPEEMIPCSEIYLTICEGKFHQIKRMMEAVGKKVLYLKRISMGPLKLPENLEKGGCRSLTEEEIAALKMRD